MAGQGADSSDSADRRGRDGIIDTRADRRIDQLVGAPPPTVVTEGNGRFVFADVGDVENIIKRLSTLSKRLRQRGVDLRRILSVVAPPARDPASRGQAEATSRSLGLAYTHNSALQRQLATYVRKLRQAKAVLVTTDSDNAGSLNRGGGG